MLSLQRLNMDNSWHIRWGETDFLMDPWLSGTEIDGFSWFNEQWHSTAPVEYKDVNPFDFVVISQPFPDHCHTETLLKLGNQFTVVGVPAAVNKLKKKITNPLQSIGLFSEPSTCIKNICISRLRSAKFLSPFNGLAIINGSEYILFAPHGAPFRKTDIIPLLSLKCKCLVTTFTLYELPFFLGGKINHGRNASEDLATLLSPEYILNTHDENKQTKGISNKIARIKYNDFSQQMPANFKWINHYQKTELP